MLYRFISDCYTISGSNKLEINCRKETVYTISLSVTGILNISTGGT